MQYHYNAVNFLTNPHKIHPIARPLGRGMGCILWVETVIYTLPQLLQLCNIIIKYHVILDSIITALYCHCISTMRITIPVRYLYNLQSVLSHCMYWQDSIFIMKKKIIMKKSSWTTAQCLSHCKTASLYWNGPPGLHIPKDLPLFPPCPLHACPPSPLSPMHAVNPIPQRSLISIRPHTLQTGKLFKISYFCFCL